MILIMAIKLKRKKTLVRGNEGIDGKRASKLFWELSRNWKGAVDRAIRSQSLERVDVYKRQSNHKAR